MSEKRQAKKRDSILATRNTLGLGPSQPNVERTKVGREEHACKVYMILRETDGWRHSNGEKTFWNRIATFNYEVGRGQQT